MSFDFDKVRQKLIANQTVFSQEGVFQVTRMLKCLEVCPFIDVVIMFLNISTADFYNKIKYHLTEEEYDLLLETLKARRKIELSNYKIQWTYKLKGKIRLDSN